MITIPRCSDGPLFAFSLFTPTIINQVGTVTIFRVSNNRPMPCISWVSHTDFGCSGTGVVDRGYNPGYKATTANLLSVPVYVWSCIVTVFVGFLGDRLGKRAYINLSA